MKSERRRNSDRRRSKLTDKKLQGAIVLYAAIYWFYCLFSVTLIAVCWIIFDQRPKTSADLFGQLWTNCGPALLGSILLLPLVLLDCLRLTTRFAGPMVPLQRAMKQLAAGETPDPVKLRKDDYWNEFADDVNSVIARCAGEQETEVAGEPIVGNAAGAPILGNAGNESPEVESEMAASESTKLPDLPESMPQDPNASVQSPYSDMTI